jgi:hypothetical protein
VEGYAYQGALFSPHHFAEMKESYDNQLLAYDGACKAMAKKHQKAGPPTDLPTLKLFLNDGKLSRSRKKNDREFRVLQKDVADVTKKLKSMMAAKEECTAPHGVILYFEGLDCSGKSSTGGLVQQALDDARFNVEMRQYNRPPTEEQKRQPWMERFELPNTSPVTDGGESGGTEDLIKLAGQCVGHRHTAVVWDRGRPVTLSTAHSPSVAKLRSVIGTASSWPLTLSTKGKTFSLSNSFSSRTATPLQAQWASVLRRERWYRIFALG